MKRLALLSLLIVMITACSDRVRDNCETTKGTGFLESKCK